MSLPKLEEILSEIRSITDRELRTEVLIEFAQRFVPVPERIALRPFEESRRVPGCESEAFVWCEKLAHGLKYHFAIENPQGVSAKALATILDQGLCGVSAAEVMELKEELVYELFGRGLSMGKSQGLMGIVRMVKALASQHR